MSQRNKFRARRAGRPLYFHVERLVRPETGEEIGCLVPAYPCDVKEMRARKYSVGTRIRGLLTKPRNELFHRKAHALGNLAVQNLEGFENLNAHDALKRLQRESGIQCEAMELDLPGVGKMTLNFPRSIAFDEMDESEFEELWNGVIGHIRAKYWPDLGEDQIEQFALMEGDPP
jgi:hypothetical protein